MGRAADDMTRLIRLLVLLMAQADEAEDYERVDELATLVADIVVSAGLNDEMAERARRILER
mgnify:CR=1 FL=1